MTFPYDITCALMKELGNICDPTDPTKKIHTVVNRKLNSTDPALVAAIQSDRYEPRVMEMCGPGRFLPTTAVYVFQIQIFIAVDNEEYGNRLINNLTQALRAMLQVGEGLQENLAGIQSSVGPVVETVSKWKMTGQQYISDQVDDEFGFVSNTTVEVEVTS